MTLTANVTPTPDAGTVSFTDGGSPIAGCGVVAVSAASPQATCTTTFGTLGQHAIVASYSGDTYYTGSSASLTQSVTPGAGGGPGTGTKVVPVISHLKARAVKRRLWLSLVLSAFSMKLQQTIERPVELAGRGLFTGEHVSLRFVPAPADTGIVFVRSDQQPPIRIPARVENVAKRLRRALQALHGHVRGARPVSTVGGAHARPRGSAHAPTQAGPHAAQPTLHMPSAEE